MNSKNLINPFFPAEYRDLQWRSRDEQRSIQEKLFIGHVKYTLKNSPFYKRHCSGLRPEDIKSLEDVSLLPFTTKQHLNEHNMDFLATDIKQIADICLTSGTSGATPTRLLQTQADLSRLAFNEEMAFRITGLTGDDTLVVCAALGQCFMAGLAYFLGGVNTGCRVVRAGAVAPPQLWELIKSQECTAVVGVPSLMQRTAEYALAQGENPGDRGVEKLIAIGESIRNADLDPLPAARRLENVWKADMMSTYASTELASTFAECKEKKGGHVRPELILVEIVAKGKPVPAGEKGEVVVTPLGVTGMPLLRFKTGDISYLIDEPCACGRTSQRLGPVLGRKNQMLKYKGTTLFPNTLIEAVEGDDAFYAGVVEARLHEGNDRVILHVSLNRDVDMNMIKQKIRAYCRVVPEINILTKQEIDAKMFTPGKRKQIRFIDRRREK